MTPHSPLRIGVIGGGQLARMLFEASLALALDLRFFVGDSDEGVRGLAEATIVGPLNYEALSRFASTCDVITFEHELVPIDILSQLAQDGHTLRPGVGTMTVATDKANQRALFAEHGLPAPPSALLTTQEDLHQTLDQIGLPAVIKATKGGFDGRAVTVVATIQDAMASTLPVMNPPVLVEPLLPLEAELAVLTVRGIDGELLHYPPVRTRQENGICIEASAPITGIRAELVAQAIQAARQIAIATDSIGVQAVEFFISADSLLVNEIAPRVHNSGHLTIEAARTSQFENHLRAVAGLPLGDVSLWSAATMVNILGSHASLTSALPTNGARVHLYGKSFRPGRKIGHITALDPDPDSASRLAWDAHAHLTKEQIND
ncbi:MAG: 5-(carboxyamino)imidazole ribonucleotide synthase [Ferrimicrobium sp.]